MLLTSSIIRFTLFAGDDTCDTSKNGCRPKCGAAVVSIALDHDGNHLRDEVFVSLDEFHRDTDLFSLARSFHTDITLANL